MSFRLKIAFCLNILVSIILIVFGLRYILASQIMPYHLQVIGCSWSDIDPRLQMLLLAGLRLDGTGQLCTGIALGILTLIPFRLGQRWAYWAIPVIGFIDLTLMISLAYSLNNATNAATPWKAMIVILLILLVAFLLTIRSPQGADPQQDESKGAPV